MYEAAAVVSIKLKIAQAETDVGKRCAYNLRKTRSPSAACSIIALASRLTVMANKLLRFTITLSIV